MTPGIDIARKAGVVHKVHEYALETRRESWGAEAAGKLGVSTSRVFKTLVVELDPGCFAVAVLPVAASLRMKAMARTLGMKRAVMANKTDVERLTGYVAGGVSPLGQKQRFDTVIDISATRHRTIYVSAGKRGLEIELDAHDLKELTGGMFADLCQ